MFNQIIFCLLTRILLTSSSKYGDEMIRALRERLEKVMFNGDLSTIEMARERDPNSLSKRNFLTDPFFSKPFDYVPERVHQNEDIEIKNICSHFRQGHELNVDRMSDIWQVVYYQLPTELSCFKMYIRRNSYEEKQQLAQQYATISDNIDWTACNLEIKPYDNTDASGRKHYLAESLHYNGVMENIFIEEQEDFDGNISYHFIRESSDQWLVLNNLLLMRDCDTGDLVVFSRVPLRPLKSDVLHALSQFGEHDPNGKMNCNNVIT